jgi:GntR family transcriptional repressor for pyruvate dehydrogenase complex
MATALTPHALTPYTQPAPPPRSSPRQLVTDWLEHRIRSGELPPGSRLPAESHLCELIGVSRSAVRDAIQRLAGSEILEVRHGVGTFVRAVTADAVLEATDLVQRLTPQSALDLLEVREIFEAGVVVVAARRATAADASAIRRALAANERAQHGDGSPVDTDERVHRALAEATHNPAIVQVMDVVNGLFRHRREQNSLTLRPEEREAEYRGHVTICEAVIAGDGEGARQAFLANMDEHRRRLIQQSRDLLRAAEQRGSSPLTAPPERPAHGE